MKVGWKTRSSSDCYVDIWSFADVDSSLPFIALPFLYIFNNVLSVSVFSGW